MSDSKKFLVSAIVVLIGGFMAAIIIDISRGRSDISRETKFIAARASR